jgi:hypothetical protein
MAASLTCVDLGGHLASIKTEAEYMAAGRAIAVARETHDIPDDDFFWIGLSDVSEEDVWRWTENGSLFDAGVLMWAPNRGTGAQPNGGKVQNCAVLNRALLLEDQDCRDDHVPLCESD